MKRAPHLAEVRAKVIVSDRPPQSERPVRKPIYSMKKFGHMFKYINF